MKKTILILSLICSFALCKGQSATALINDTIGIWHVVVTLSPPSSISSFIDVDENLTVLPTSKMFCVVTLDIYLLSTGKKVTRRDNRFSVEASYVEIIEFQKGKQYNNAFESMLSLYPLLGSKVVQVIDFTHIENYIGETY